MAGWETEKNLRTRLFLDAVQHGIIPAATMDETI